MSHHTECRVCGRDLFPWIDKVLCQSLNDCVSPQTNHLTAELASLKQAVMTIADQLGIDVSDMSYHESEEEEDADEEIVD